MKEVSVDNLFRFLGDAITGEECTRKNDKERYQYPIVNSVV